MPSGHRADVASCMAHMAEGKGLRTWSDRSVGGGTQVHCHHFGEEAAREQVLGLQDRTEDSRLPRPLVLEVRERTGRENLAGSQPD